MTSQRPSIVTAVSERSTSMTIKRIGRTALAAMAVATFAVACSDDTDDGGNDVTDTLGAAVDDITDDS
jgi:hypothetical protein